MFLHALSQYRHRVELTQRVRALDRKLVALVHAHVSQDIHTLAALQMGSICSAAGGFKTMTRLKLLYAAAMHQMASSMHQVSGTKFGIAGKVWDSRQSLA